MPCRWTSLSLFSCCGTAHIHDHFCRHRKRAKLHHLLGKMRRQEPRLAPFCVQNHSNLTMLYHHHGLAGTGWHRFWAFCRGETAVPEFRLSWVINITEMKGEIQAPLWAPSAGYSRSLCQHDSTKTFHSRQRGPPQKKATYRLWFAVRSFILMR